MEYIYSKVEPTKLLHIIHRLSELENREAPRVDIVSEDNFIQCSSLRLHNGKTFKPHKHIWKERTEQKIAQESWIIVRGKVKFIFYDIDDTIIATPILEAGDASFTLEGGHNYEILEDNTLVYEYKTGPYEGQSFDKKFIE
jgi:hypothetical protein